MIFLGIAESFKIMNRPDRDAIWRHISWKLLKIRAWNFDTILIKVLILCYQNARSISLTVWQLRAFRCNVTILAIFQQLFITTFDWNENFKFWWFNWKDLAQIYCIQLYFNLTKYLYIFVCCFLKSKIFGF